MFSDCGSARLTYFTKSEGSSVKLIRDAKIWGPCCLSAGGGKGPTRTAIEGLLNIGMGKVGNTPASNGSCYGRN